MEAPASRAPHRRWAGSTTRPSAARRAAWADRRPAPSRPWCRRRAPGERAFPCVTRQAARYFFALLRLRDFPLLRARVRAALLALADRSAFVRALAARFPCDASAFFDPAFVLSRF